MMTDDTDAASPWPIDLALPEVGEAHDVHILDGALRLDRASPHQLLYRRPAESKDAFVGLRGGSDTLRFIPFLGELPLLIFPSMSLLIPASGRLEAALTSPIFLRAGVGPADGPFDRIDDFPSGPGHRALYGPVDAGKICRSIFSNVYPSMKAAARDVGLTKETSTEAEGKHPYLAAPPRAIIPMEIINQTSAPLEVGRVMLPTELVGLYQWDAELLFSKVRMKLLSAQEAELTFVGAPDGAAEPVCDLAGQPITPAPRAHVFAHSYKNKTGLEFGF